MNCTIHSKGIPTSTLNIQSVHVQWLHNDSMLLTILSTIASLNWRAILYYSEIFTLNRDGVMYSNCEIHWRVSGSGVTVCEGNLEGLMMTLWRLVLLWGILSHHCPYSQDLQWLWTRRLELTRGLVTIAMMARMGLGLTLGEKYLSPIINLVKTSSVEPYHRMVPRGSNPRGSGERTSQWWSDTILRRTFWTNITLSQA